MVRVEPGKLRVSQLAQLQLGKVSRGGLPSTEEHISQGRISNRASRSPTAQLLRSSRFFSVPHPLPRPDFNTSSANGLIRDSPSATTPYPLKQAITTPESSRCRGDWGLKRPLPLRSTTTTTNPSLRINSVDTLEHVTDYESAADHSQTVVKFQELNLPLSSEATGYRASDYAKSPFEKETDNTDPAVSTQVRGAAKGLARWKFEGPWVAGMSEGDFNAYLEHTLSRTHKAEEFKAFVKRWLTQVLIQKKRAESREHATDMEGIEKSVNVTNEDVEGWIQAKRKDTSLSSDLSNAIREFLDLPPLYHKVDDSTVHGRIFEKLNEDSAASRRTHASAGLSYLRTASFLENHPVLGPQAHHRPVQARVVKPQQSMTTGVKSASIGVAGIIGNDSRTSPFGSHNNRGVDKLNIDIEGGAKVWVNPVRASISAQGHVNLEIARAEKIAVDIAQGKAVQAHGSNDTRLEFPYLSQSYRESDAYNSNRSAAFSSLPTGRQTKTSQQSRDPQKIREDEKLILEMTETMQKALQQPRR